MTQAERAVLLHAHDAAILSVDRVLASLDRMAEIERRCAERDWHDPVFNIAEERN